MHVRGETSSHIHRKTRSGYGIREPLWRSFLEALVMDTQMGAAVHQSSGGNTSCQIVSVPLRDTVEMGVEVGMRPYLVSNNEQM